MFGFLKKRAVCIGSALFEGPLPPHVGEMERLAAFGIQLERRPEHPEMHWSLELRHPDWGRAEAVCPRQVETPLRELLALDPRLDPAEVEAIARCRTQVLLRMEGTGELVLRDRKHMLCFLGAILGEHGVAAIDHTSSTPWTRPALADELDHDADLDIQSLFVIHAVRDEDGGGTGWFHTHGLAELGALDFDILRPSQEFVDNSGEYTRALAFALLEGRAKAGMTAFDPGHRLFPLQLVPADRFMRTAAPADTALRDDPQGQHTTDRVVLCDPPPRGLGRLFGRDHPRPARGFAAPLPDNPMLTFSNAASELTADRARRTYPVLREIAAELADLALPVLVKLGYVIDGGGPTDREHLWFVAHTLGDDTIDGTLINQPYHIARLRENDRGTHPVQLLSDWTVLTPLGSITPRALYARRFIRARRAEVEQIVADARRGAS